MLPIWLADLMRTPWSALGPPLSVPLAELLICGECRCVWGMGRERPEVRYLAFNDPGSYHLLQILSVFSQRPL